MGTSPLVWMRCIRDMNPAAINAASTGARAAPIKACAFAIGLRADRHTGQCNPSFDRIADDSGLSRRAVIGAVEFLVDSGWLVRIRQRGEGGRQTSNIYVLTMPQNVTVHSARVQEVHSARVQEMHSRSAGGAPSGGAGGAPKGVKVSKGARNAVDALVENLGSDHRLPADSRSLAQLLVAAGLPVDDVMSMSPGERFRRLGELGA